MNVTGVSNEHTAPPSVAREVTTFVVPSLLAIVVLIGGSVLVLRELGRTEAIREARNTAQLAATGIVEPALENAILAGDAGAIARLDRVVQARVLNDQIVRVKIWSSTGRILYSDVPQLIGDEYRLGRDELEVLTSGGVEAELSDLSGPENQYESSEGELLEVYLPLRTPNGTPVLFEMYQRFDSIVASGRRIWVSFLPPLLGGLLLLWLVQVPLAFRLARRVRDVHAEREALLRRTLDASNDERRRIAGDLHAGLVQDLAGISYSLSAAADRDADGRTDPELVATLREAAEGTRESLQRLRSLLVAIHPPNLRASGITPALRDLLAPLERRGVETQLDVADPHAYGDETESLLYRAAREAIQNTQDHAEPSRVEVRVEADGGVARLTVADDGRGFTDEELGERREQGHVGLSLVDELAAHAGGSVRIESRPGAGTTVIVEVPR